MIRKLLCWLGWHEWTFEPYIHCKRCGKRHINYYHDFLFWIVTALIILCFGIVER